MTRTIKLFAVFIILTVMLAAAIPANAYIYAGKRKKINCGVVVVNRGTNQPLTNVGHLFYLLDSRVDLKPSGWSFENPYAPGSHSTGLGKNNPEYWYVNLETVREISNMDVLYFPAYGNVTLDNDDKEKLRRFVDGGGVLWIDNSSEGLNQLNFRDSFFIPKFLFKSNSGNGYDAPVSRHHPVLTLPFWLTESDIAAMGANAGKSHCEPGYEPSNTNGWLDYSSEPTSFDVLYPVVNYVPVGLGSSVPSVAANSYGSGRIVATSNYIGLGCYSPYPLNLPNLKFAYNVVAWASSWTQPRKDPRHSGASIDTVGGTKLLESWSFPATPVEGESAPVIYKNMVFYTVGSTVYALDVDPQEDLDQDGNRDDGIQGLPVGMADNGQDIVWMWQSGSGSLSSPAIVTAQDPRDPSKSIEAVLVMSSEGTVYMLDAFSCDSGTGQLLGTPGTPIVEWTPASETPPSPPRTPLYINGWIYALNGDGHLCAYNPSLKNWDSVNNPNPPSSYEWQVPHPSRPAKCTVKGGPSFGFVKSETNGAVIGMVYWYGSSYPPATSLNDWVYGVPVYVANDRLKIERKNPTGPVACRTVYTNKSIATVPAPIVTVNGVVATSVDVNEREGISAPGWLTINTPTVNTGDVVYASYALEYGGPIGQGNPVFQKYMEPNTTGPMYPATTINSTPAMGQGNMMFLSCSRSVGSDTLYGVRNDGTTQLTKWAFQFHDGIEQEKFRFTSADIPLIPPTIFDETTGAELTGARLYSSPAVVGDKVFVAVSGSSSDPSKPSAALACFKANPNFVIQITESGGFGPNGKPVRKPKRLYNTNGTRRQVKIWQPNVVPVDLIPAPPPSGGTLLNAYSVVDYDKGTITFDSFDAIKMIFGATTGSLFSPSIPVWVYLDGVEVPVDFNTWNPCVKHPAIGGGSIKPNRGDAVDLSNWNNLLWYYILPEHDGKACSGIHNSPVVVGNTVYFVCDDGWVFALPTDPGETAGGQISSDKLIWSEKIGSSTVSAANMSIAGSNGVLMIPGADALYAYTNSTTLVSEGGRVLELDGAGEVGWSIDSISWPVAIPTTSSAPARDTGSVNKPGKVKYVGDELLLVNSGANQVCKIDKSGSVGIERIGNTNKYIRWMWDKFSDPKRLLRPGQPTQLSAPTDAIYWREYTVENGVPVMIIHCLIADSGNHRILDLVYKVETNRQTGQVVDLLASNISEVQPDPNNGFYLPELNWVSVTDSISEKYNYQSIQLVPETSGVQCIWAAASNYKTGTGDPMSVRNQGLGGAVVAVKYREFSSGRWDYSADNSGRIVAALDRASWNGNVRPIANPRYFQVINRTITDRYILVCDNYGVYEVGPLGGDAPAVTRSFLDSDYRSIDRGVIGECNKVTYTYTGGTGVPLMATSVQELPNGNWLISNGYSGTAPASANNRFAGEVFELNWTKTGGIYSSNGIKWCSPALWGECDYSPDDTPIGVVNWFQKMNNTYLLEQPTYAYRKF